MIRGFVLYCDIVAALKRDPLKSSQHGPKPLGRTAKQVHALMGEPIELQKFRRVLRRLCDGGALRLVGMTPGQHGERIYAFGDGRPGAPLPGGFATRPATRMAHVARFLAVWDEITEPTSVEDVIEAIGGSLSATRKLLKRMVKVGIAGTSRDEYRRSTPLYQRGVANSPMPPRPRAWQREARRGRELHQVFAFWAPPVVEERAEP
jgi:hypothetical protein